MKTGRHALYLEDEETSLFQAEAGRDVRLDVPLVGVVRNAQDVSWLWRDRIPFGHLTLIEGAPRSGKSFVAHDLAARLSSGQAWPDSDDTVPEGLIPPSEPMCLLISLQHTRVDTLGRRLQLAGGDPTRVLHLSQFLSTDSKERESLRAARFPDDLPVVEHLLDKHKHLLLIVIDPLSDFCRTPALMTETIHTLNDLANERNIAVVATLRAMSRFDGRGRLEVKSRWPTEAARCTWFVALDPDDDSRRLFVPTRTNFCVEPHGLGFSIESGRVVWDVAGAVDARDPLKNLSGSALWLSQLLAEGDVPAKVVFRLGAECGYTVEMLKYAANRIGVHKHRIGFAADGIWKWTLRPAHLSLEASLNLVTGRPGSLAIENQPADRPTHLLEQSAAVAAPQIDGERAAETSPDSI